ncbi:amylosucrase [Gordonia sp. NPDC003424]
MHDDIVSGLVDSVSAMAAAGRIDSEDAVTLTRRVRRWGPDLLDGLGVYAGDDNDLCSVALRVVDLVAAAHRARRPALRELDEERVLRPDWFADPAQIGYVTYVDRFAGTLAGVADHLDHLGELGITYLHLMPLLDPRPGDADGGYAIRDYRSVRADLGTMDDLADLADRLHEAGIALTLDLVLNHVAREHAWAQAAMAGDATYVDYFLSFTDREWPDRYERDLLEVFPDFARGNFTWVPGFAGDDGRWVWTTFNDFQWDLDWANPDVFCELLDVALFLANVGVDCLRLDAIAFLWKRLGTTCQNQPEVHQITEALRAAMHIAAPGVVFKAEAIVSPEDLPAYLGTGRRAGKVCDLAYQNSLMVQLWSALATGDAALARHTLSVSPPKPVTTAWATYARCHDDIGWAITDEHADAVGVSGWAHRAFLSAWYSGTFPGSFARGAVFQSNPDTGDARISGTLASLAGLEAAMDADDSRAVDLALARIFWLHAVIFGYGGIPLVYMGDEIGLLNDWSFREDPATAADNRWLHRPAMPWETVADRHDPTTVAGRVFAGLRHLGRVRAALPSLHASVESAPIDVHNPTVLALGRRHPAGTLVQLYNTSAQWQPVSASRIGELVGDRPVDHISQVHPDIGGGAAYWLAPYAAWWLSAD